MSKPKASTVAVAVKPVNGEPTFFDTQVVFCLLKKELIISKLLRSTIEKHGGQCGRNMH